ncbi:MAG: hypothetical protein AVDCRST_MAG73-1310, partial [uncultured Thermomicrobiales bacterium]
ERQRTPRIGQGRLRRRHRPRRGRDRPGQRRERPARRDRASFRRIVPRQRSSRVHQRRHLSSVDRAGVPGGRRGV